MGHFLFPIIIIIHTIMLCHISLCGLSVVQLEVDLAPPPGIAIVSEYLELNTTGVLRIKHVFYYLVTTVSTKFPRNGDEH